MSIRRVVVGTIWIAMCAQRSLLAGGGDTCDLATIVGPLPFVDTGNTCSGTNSYDEGCSALSTSPELVYEFFSPVDQCVDITLCSGTLFDAKLYVYATDAGGCPPVGTGDSPNEIACVDDGCSGANDLAPEIVDLPLFAGQTYYIVVDGSGGECGDYQIQISACGPPCCIGGDCLEMDPVNCGLAGGFPMEGTEACDATTCLLGACCLAPGACVDNAGIGITQADCEALEGTYHGGARCTDFPCDVFPCSDDLDCDDGDPCTDDLCDQEESVCFNTSIDECCNTNVDCLDGQFCNGAEYCEDHVCQSGNPNDCDDGDPCTEDVCDEVLDRCENNVLPECCEFDGECEDGNECTLDTCNAGVCEQSFAPAGTECGDSAVTLCSASDTCDGSGICDPNDADPGSPCGDQSGTPCTDPDTCDEQAICQPNDAPFGSECDDGDMCTSDDICAEGTCMGTDDGSCQECVQSGDGADPASQLGFQALLTDASGNPIQDPTVELAFQFYDLLGNPVGAPILLPEVPVTSGIVTTGIPIIETIFSGGGRELGVSVNGTQEMLPRIAVRSSAQSFITQCANADAVVDHIAFGGVQKGGGLEIIDASGASALSVTTTADGRTQFRIGPPPSQRSGGEGFCWGPEETETEESEIGNSWTLENIDGITTIELDPTTSDLFAGGSTAGQVIVYDGNGDTNIVLQGAPSNGSPQIELYEFGEGLNPEPTVILSAEDNGTLFLGQQRSDNTYPVRIDGNYAGSGKSRIATDSLTIRGGSDLSELFDVSGAVPLMPGMVTSIDATSSGKLVISSAPYDRRVAGVISGAGDINTGLVMGEDGTLADGEIPVALTGRVYVRVDASFGAVEPGDLLTTSSTPGHAMKVVDHSRAQGAILGKAMTGLESGRGLVLVLVTLQ